MSKRHGLPTCKSGAHDGVQEWVLLLLYVATGIKGIVLGKRSTLRLLKNEAGKGLLRLEHCMLTR